jgi:hypothetical protein
MSREDEDRYFAIRAVNIQGNCLLLFSNETSGIDYTVTSNRRIAGTKRAGDRSRSQLFDRQTCLFPLLADANSTS